MSSRLTTHFNINNIYNKRLVFNINVRQDKNCLPKKRNNILISISLRPLIVLVLNMLLMILHLFRFKEVSRKEIKKSLKSWISSLFGN